MFSGLLALLCLLVAGDGVQWVGDYESAFRLAEERNVPVLLAFNMDGEPASDSTARSLYRDPEFVARSRDFVCLIASTATHEAAAGGPDEAAGKLCSRFLAVSCQEHLKVEIRASEEFIGQDTVISPQHLLISPRRAVLARRAYQIGKGELLQMMELAAHAVATGRADPGADARLKDLKKRALDHNAEVRKLAIGELGRIATVEARAQLFELAGPRNGDMTRMDAVDALAQKGNYDALPLLLDLTRDKSQLVAIHAIVALEKLELPAAVAELLKLWKKKPKGMIAKEIPRALARCAPRDPAVRDVVIAAANSTDSAIEAAAIVALADLPAGDDSFALLAKKLKDRSGNVRGLAVLTLGCITGEAGAQARALLEKSLGDESNVEVREAIAAALGALAGDGRNDPALTRLYGTFLEEDVPR